MPRLLQLLSGPELFWCAIFGGASLLSRMNTPPVKAMDSFIENLYLVIPALTILSFSLWYIPGVEKNGLLLRVWIAGLVGAHFVLEKGLGAYSQQGPGIGMTYIAGMLFVFLALVAGSIFIKLKF